MEDAIELAAQACGGLAKLAALMGESSQTVSNWRARGVPVQRCAELESAAGGMVRRWELRPEDWHRIWPELIGMEGAPAIPDPTTAEPARA